MQPLDADMFVGLLGIAMALFLVSQHSALQTLTMPRRVLYGVVWAVAFGLVAAIMTRIYG